MKKIGLFYGSDTDCTYDVVKKLKDYLKDDLDLIYIADSSSEEIQNYENIIFATPTWGKGKLQSDWEDFKDSLDDVDFCNKTIALIGLGDQESYSDTFCDAIGILYEKVKHGKIIGQTSIEGYNFEKSKALVNDRFVGLIIDERNQEDLTETRIESWAKQIQKEFRD